MLLTELTKYIKCSKIYHFHNKKLNFKYIYTNSKNIIPKSIFVINDYKEKYLKEAIQRGAIAIITKKYINSAKIPQFIVKNIDESIFLVLNKIRPFQPKKSMNFYKKPLTRLVRV